MLSQALGQYAIQEELGSGGMGVVYRARDVRLDRPVALKVLWEHFRADGTAWARLVQEARAVSALNHPNICTVYDVGEDEGKAYIAMELVEGRTLRAVIPGHGLPVEAVVSYGERIADAIAHAHERGIFHGDLASSNVMVTAEGRLKVLDFGLARRKSGVGSSYGSDPAAAEAADLRQLGALLYEMATGGLPKSTEAGLEAEAASLHRIPSRLRAVISRCLAAGGEGGYRRAREVGDDLQAQLAPAASLSLRVSLPKLSRRARLGVLAASLAAGLLVVGVPRLWKPGPPTPVVRPAPPKTDAAANTATPAGSVAATPKLQKPARAAVHDPKVWVNRTSGVYHCSGSQWYGATKQGEYMGQREARAKGYRPALGLPCP